MIDNGSYKTFTDQSVVKYGVYLLFTLRLCILLHSASHKYAYYTVETSILMTFSYLKRGILYSG